MGNRSQVAQSHRPGGVQALRPLTGAGLAALLSIELVVADAVLGNQVAPAEVVHTLFLCRDDKKQGTITAADQMKAAANDCIHLLSLWIISNSLINHSAESKSLKIVAEQKQKQYL